MTSKARIAAPQTEFRSLSAVRFFVGSILVFAALAVLTEMQRGSLHGFVPVGLAEQMGMDRWFSEDGPLETGTSILAAAAGILLLWVHYLCWKLKILERPSHYTLLALLATMMIFFAGEEISWGQRLIGFGTPDLMLQYNKQEEFNLHNVGLIHSYKDGLLALGILVWGVILPLTKPFVGAVAKLQRLMHLPLPPLQYVGYFAAAIGFRVIFKTIYGNMGQEGLEFIFALAMFLLSWHAMRRPRALFE